MFYFISTARYQDAHSHNARSQWVAQTLVSSCIFFPFTSSFVSAVMAASVHIFYEFVNREPEKHKDLVSSFANILRQVMRPFNFSVFV